MNSGMVYFVGAGPGDIDLITVKGKQALQKADVVIFDRLINPFLLTDVKEEAKLIYCGKQPCKHTLRQEDIQKEILIHARKGKTVVRLKGGDPAVFGRVGEEAELLAEHRINYEIIPGITAGIAATMYSGVPITHRKHSNSFAVVTGHGSRDDGTPKVNWEHLAKGVETIVFYMGIKHLKTITSELVKHGKPKETEALVVQWGTYSKQRTVTGSLATLANKVEQANITNPAIIVVGDVVKLRSKLAWFDNRPLTGWSFLLPSKDEANRKMTTTLKSKGADVFEHEMLSEDFDFERDFSNQITELSRETELIFLSPQSVRNFLKALGENGLDLRDIHSSIFALDEDVKAALQLYGLQSCMVQEAQLGTGILVGGEAEIESLRYKLSISAKSITVSKSKSAKKDCEAFTRLLDEQHVNTLLFTSRVQVNKFLKFLKLSEISIKSVLAKVKVVCTDKESSYVLEANGMPVDIYMEDKSRIMDLLSERTVLAKES
jgi:uroporphyrinogen III methyltransferase/synthase